MLLTAAVRDVGPDRMAIRNWLESLGRTREPWMGVTGPIAFSRQRSEILRMTGPEEGRAMTDERTRIRASLRTSMMGFGVAAVVYVAVLGLLVILAIQPSSTRLRQSSQSVLEEYRESSLRAATLDVAVNQLWRLVGMARTSQLPLDTLESLRNGIERLAETSNATNRLSSSSGSASGLRTILAEAVVYEERLRTAALGVIASLELGDLPSADLSSGAPTPWTRRCRRR